MAVLKEFSCRAHGAFEAMVNQGETPECPKGCSPKWVTREFRTAPSARGAATGKLDKLQGQLAMDFGLSNLKVGKDDGKSVIQNLRGSEDFSPKWVDMPSQMRPGWSQRGEKPAPINVNTTFGMNGDNALKGMDRKKSLPTEFIGPRGSAADLSGSTA